MADAIQNNFRLKPNLLPYANKNATKESKTAPRFTIINAQKIPENAIIK
jgi:hypothetical protein